MRVFLFTFFVALFLGAALFSAVWYTQNYINPPGPRETAIEVGHLRDLLAEKMSNTDANKEGVDEWEIVEETDRDEAIDELRDGDSRGLPATTGPKVEKKQQKPRGTPRGKLDKSIYEFGSIDEGEVITHHFQILNRGTAPLKITDFEVGCGCTMVEFPRTPIQPGKSVKIKAVFDSKDKMGPQKKLLRLKTNGTPRNLDMYFKGWVYPKDFGKDADSTATQGKDSSEVGRINELSNNL